MRDIKGPLDHLLASGEPTTSDLISTSSVSLGGMATRAAMGKMIREPRISGKSNLREGGRGGDELCHQDSPRCKGQKTQRALLWHKLEFTDSWNWNARRSTSCGSCSVQGLRNVSELLLHLLHLLSAVVAPFSGRLYPSLARWPSSGLHGSNFSQKEKNAFLW